MHSKWKKYARHQTQKKIYIEWMEMKGKPMHCAHFAKRNKNKFADFIRIWWDEVVCDWLADFFLLSGIAHCCSSCHPHACTCVLCLVCEGGCESE